MSHLTASPFHKPSPFEFPQRLGISDATVHAPSYPTPASLVGPDLHSSEYFETPAASISPDAPGARLRRAASSIVYHNSGLRESRERTVQRSSRSFLVVLPPPSLPQDHGHLGNTLSSGPRHRLSHGLLMPLFPTMYGQLTAIAREYNFPSTTGLCLYLHYNEHGITATPRISDDSWQIIWSHALDPAAPTHGLPVCGKIEFDIDMRLARWYGAWMASSHREHVDVPMSVTPSAAPSVVHYREGSRTTFADGDDQDNQSVARPPPRHVPRKLSLVDRFDAMSARSVPRSLVTRAPAPEQAPGSQNLSPIFQEDEPKTAKYDLEHKVKSWRASAIVPAAAAIAETGHILLAGPNIPNSPPVDSPIVTSNDDEREYRIEDYSFSISSAGPGDYDPYSPLSWYYDPSVHLANRVQGSVMMSPSTCTSFGPSDYTLPPYVPDLDHDRVHTPDIAQRMFEDVPPSPSVATSWGAPLSYPPSPISEYRALSVHLADRQEFSRPVTPMTATSWGAPESFPPSPVTPFYVRTPDAGQRSFDESLHHAPWSHVWPYHDRSATTPWNMVWPHDIEEAANDEPKASVHEHSATTPWNMVWPHGLDHTVGPWQMVWPFHDQATPSSAASHRGVEISLMNYPSLASLYPCYVTIRLPAAYPRFDLYLPQYPHNLSDIYPEVDSVVNRGPITIDLAEYASLRALYPGQGYPWNLDNIYADVAASRNHGPIVIDVAGYPALKNLYVLLDSALQCYPWNLYSIYPVVSAPRIQSSIGIDLAGYPSLKTLYAAPQGYPWNLHSIYPDVTSSRSLHGPIEVDLAEYAALRNLYPPQGYPWNLQWIYPDVTSSRSLRGPIEVDLADYVALRNLYPPQGYPWNLQRIYSDLVTTHHQGPIVIDVEQYPALKTLYPGHGYPWSLDFIYLGLANPYDTHGPVTIDLTEYTSLKYLYPAQGYPWNLDAIYLNINVPTLHGQGVIEIDVAGYPALRSLYCAQGYPWNLDNIYSDLVAPNNRGPIVVDLTEYVALKNLYPAQGYPWNLYNIYANVAAPSSKGPIVIDVTGYPGLRSLYPAKSLAVPISKGLGGSIQIEPCLGYPHLLIYRAVFPYFDLYGDSSVPALTAPRVRRQSRFTSSDLHALMNKSTFKPKSPLPRKTHADLHLTLFPRGTDVSTPSGTVLPKIRKPSKTHLELHLSVFPSGVVFSPSGTTPVTRPAASPVRTPSASPAPTLSASVAPTPSASPAPPSATPPRALRARSGSVLRTSLPPSPRPVGGRSPVSRAPTIPIPPTPVDPPRVVSDRLSRSPASLTRAVSMAHPPPSSADEFSPKLSRSASTGGPRGPMRQRDSLVMQRVRAMQMQASETSIPEKEDDGLSSFPMPPRQTPPFPVRKVLP